MKNKILGFCTLLLLAAPGARAAPFACYELTSASESNDLAKVQRLIHDGADVNCLSERNGLTPLVTAAWSGSAEVAELLINSGANVDQQVKDSETHAYWHRETALIAASEYGRLSIVNLLIKSGANVELRGAVSGITPLIAAIGHSSHGSVVLALLNTHKINIDAVIEVRSLNPDPRYEDRISQYFTALNLVSKIGGEEEFNAVIAAGANVNLASKSGKAIFFLDTPYQSHHYESDDVSPLFVAAVNRYDGNATNSFRVIDAVRDLIGRHADVNFKNTEARSPVVALAYREYTPSGYCLNKEELEIMSLLLRSGANPNLVDNNCSSAADYAQCPDTIKLLSDYNAHKAPRCH